MQGGPKMSPFPFVYFVVEKNFYWITEDMEGHRDYRAGGTPHAGALTTLENRSHLS